jgi:hypothetical protein
MGRRRWRGPGHVLARARAMHAEFGGSFRVGPGGWGVRAREQAEGTAGEGVVRRVGGVGVDAAFLRAQTGSIKSLGEIGAGMMRDSRAPPGQAGVW